MKHWDASQVSFKMTSATLLSKLGLNPHLNNRAVAARCQHTAGTLWIVQPDAAVSG